jgi:hypothetical protein
MSRYVQVIGSRIQERGLHCITGECWPVVDRTYLGLMLWSLVRLYMGGEYWGTGKL